MQKACLLPSPVGERARVARPLGALEQSATFHGTGRPQPAAVRHAAALIVVHVDGLPPGLDDPN
jgi:hypothetical protein